jgi:hypothetical protein
MAGKPEHSANLELGRILDLVQIGQFLPGDVIDKGDVIECVPGLDNMDRMVATPSQRSK